MGSFQEDIEKYTALWDKAVRENAFGKKEKEKDVKPDVGYFGTPSYIPDEEMDQQLLESKKLKFQENLKIWTNLLQDFCPNNEEILKEEKKEEKPHFNPIEKFSVGKDQEPKVTQNFAMGGKEYFKLEELKVKLEKLESELNALDANSSEKESKKMQSKIDDLKQEIDDVSDSLAKE